MAHQFRKLDQLAWVLLQVSGAKGAPQVVGLYVRFLEAALSDPPDFAVLPRYVWTTPRTDDTAGTKVGITLP